MDQETFENKLRECMSKQWFLEKIQHQYAHLPERNRLQNSFLDTDFQKIVMKKYVDDENGLLDRPDISRFYETEFYQKCMNGKRFTLDTEIDIEFNPDTFWDVIMTRSYVGNSMTCTFADMEVVNFHSQKLNEKLKSGTITIYDYSYPVPTIQCKLSYFDHRTSRVRCLIRPTLGDDYPSVLRSINTSVLNDDDDGIVIYRVLLVEHFTAMYTSKEQLIDIFKNSGIDVLFYNDLLGYN